LGKWIVEGIVHWLGKWIVEGIVHWLGKWIVEGIFAFIHSVYIFRKTLISDTTSKTLLEQPVHNHKGSLTLETIFISTLFIVSNLSFPQSDNCVFRKIEFLFHEDRQNTGVCKYCGVWRIDYTLSSLAYISPVSSPLRGHML